MSGKTGPHAPPSDGVVGDHILVDGRAAPYFPVTADRYRLRLLNASPFQTYDFALSDGHPFVQIGTGDDLLPKPVVRESIPLGPSQRADVIVDFHGELHKRVVLEDVAETTPPSGVQTPTASLMQFRVNWRAPDHSVLPATLEAPPRITAPRKPSMTWTFGLGGNATTGTYWTVNGKPFDPRRVDVEVPLGATRTWLLRNVSPLTHYIHLHEEQWHTILRDGKPPPPWERGLEDTWRLDPGETVEVAAHFTDYTGVFMLHCHMLVHEDDGMMAQFAVVKPHTTALPPGYFLASTGTHTARPSARTAARSMAGSMAGMVSGPMSPPGAGTGLSALPRTAVGRAGQALLIEAVLVMLVIGLRRYWRFA
jgi:FtsP/CotA-like multicopper oxidase with cupredoxin domain